MSNLEGLSTQISGKYSPDNPDLFAFRQRLVAFGMDVRFPAGNDIIEYAENFAITVPHERVTPFPDTERAFMGSIGTSDLHIAYNVWGAEEGYIGESTAIETIEALAHNVPTVWLRTLGRLSPHIGGALQCFTERAFLHLPHIEPLDRMSDAELLAAIGRLVNRETGVHEWSANVPRPNFHNGTYSWGPYVDSRMHLGSSTLLWPFINEYEEEVFWGIKSDLLDQYSSAWERYAYSNEISQ